MQDVKSAIEKRRLTKILFLTFMFMMLGTLLELYLLDHFEDWKQLIPIVCIAAAMLTFVIFSFKKSVIANFLFKAVLLLTAASGFYGIFLHLKANYEFEIEMTPAATNSHLLVESLSGALPALAPLSMVVLALLGYSYLIHINQKS